MCIVPMHHTVLISVTRDGCYCHNMEEEFEDTKGGRGRVESVYRRRTDNTMAKRKSTKEQTTIYKTYT